jgi:uncharacterized protein YjiS (DUF1127 family)
MAARTRKVKLDDNWRERIRTSMLLNRLQDHAFGEVELTQSQIKAIEILLRKTAPDLAATQISGPDGGPVLLNAIERLIVDPAH